MKYQDFKFFTKIPDYNSENDMTTGILSFDDRRCKRCGICTFICPGRSIIRDTSPGGWKNGLPRLISIAKGITDCIACGCCVAACPEGAIRIERQFNPGYFFHRLSQTDHMTYPKSYGENDLPPSKTEDASQIEMPENPRQEKKMKWIYKRRQMALLYSAISAFIRVTVEEIREGRIIDDIRARCRKDTNDISWAQLLETRARQKPDKIFLNYKNEHGDETFTFRQMDDNANRMANFLLQHGGGKGKGLGIFMKNSPRFLDIFFGAQKIGMYLVPINPGLKGDGLSYLINHSDIESLVMDAELIKSYHTAAEDVKNLRRIFVDDVEEAQGSSLPDGMIPLSRAYAHPPENPNVGYNPEDMCLIIYTSGTTGRPKGVVYRYKKSSVKILSFIAHFLLKKDDVYYTCLPLVHGNALFVTTTMALARGASVALSRKFSASRFFETLQETHTTVFNTIGAIIPILMKQPEKESDRQHKVRAVFSAACPTDMWRPFEKRFGVQLYEVYGAVDGGGKGIMNLGTAPVGSLGKPRNQREIKIADAAGNPVERGESGELLFKLKKGGVSAVEYYKNTDASSEKSGDGWLHTGDLVRQDSDGFIYFVGRNTESMRKGGENVSAYEVEHVIMEHPAVEEVAVYAAPSDMSEDEIMAAVKRVNGQTVTAADLRTFLSERLARYAVPRFIRFVDDFPKTTSHRIIKKPLQDEGVTADTDDGNLNQ